MADALVSEEGIRPLNIFLVEDDDGDAKSAIRAFSRVKVVNPILRAQDGKEALDMLRGVDGYEKPPKPYILLIDINMPRMDGIELVTEIRKDEDLKNSIIFILTTSKSAEDILRAYNLNVAGVYCKGNCGTGLFKSGEHDRYLLAARGAARIGAHKCHHNSFQFWLLTTIWATANK